MKDNEIKKQKINITAQHTDINEFKKGF